MGSSENMWNYGLSCTLAGDGARANTVTHTVALVFCPPDLLGRTRTKAGGSQQLPGRRRRRRGTTTSGETSTATNAVTGQVNLCQSQSRAVHFPGGREEGPSALSWLAPSLPPSSFPPPPLRSSAHKPTPPWEGEGRGGGGGGGGGGPLWGGWGQEIQSPPTEIFATT